MNARIIPELLELFLTQYPRSVRILSTMSKAAPATENWALLDLNQRPPACRWRSPSVGDAHQLSKLEDIAPRFYIRIKCKDGRTFLRGDYATREEAEAANASPSKRRPGTQRFIDSYIPTDEARTNNAERFDFEAKNAFVIENGVVRLPVNLGKTILVDEEDWPRIKAYKWRAHWLGRCYYATAQKLAPDRGIIYLHRLITNAPRGKIVDHINHDPLDNRKRNLRLTDSSVNALNRKGPTKSNTCGRRGVIRSKKTGNWIGRIDVRGKRITVGTFKDKDAAHAAVQAKLRELGVTLAS